MDQPWGIGILHFVLISRPGLEAPVVAAACEEWNQAVDAFRAAISDPANAECRVVLARRVIGRKVPKKEGGAT